MRLQSAARTHHGPLGKLNEDSFLASDARGVYIVSDGLGRRHGAALASRTVVEAASDALLGWGMPSQVVAYAQRALEAKAKADRSMSEMAATLTLLRIEGSRFDVIHVGDSRAYAFRHGNLRQITCDHSVAYDQYLAGVLTKEQIPNHPSQKLLTRALHPGAKSKPDHLAGETKSGDLFLLCTDGLTKELTDDDILKVFKARSSPAGICSSLLDEALARGPRDNLTLVVVAVSEL